MIQPLLSLPSETADMPPAFTQSPLKSFRSHVAEGGRDPRVDPQPGDEVGQRLPTMHRTHVVEEVKRGRVRGQAVAKDKAPRGWSDRTGPFEVSLESWQRDNATVSVFVVAGDNP